MNPGVKPLQSDDIKTFWSVSKCVFNGSLFFNHAQEWGQPGSLNTLIKEIEITTASLTSPL